MIVAGLTGGMGQGKSTVGEILRGLAGVDYKADLETSYIISEVANAWMETWPRPLALKPGEQMVELANELISNLPPILERLTSKTPVAAKLLIDASDPQSLELHKRLLKYLDQWILLSEAELAVELPTPIRAENKGLHRSLLFWLGGVMIELVSPTIWCDQLDRRIKQLEERGYKLVSVGGIRYPQDAAMIRSNGGMVLKVERPHAHHGSDVTETAMKDIHPDTVLFNDGTLEQLTAAVERLWQDLQAGKPQAEYKSV